MTLPQINHPEPIATTAEDAPAYWQRDALWSVLLSGQATLGQLTMIEQLMPEGNGPPPHIHERMAEGFYVLDGTIDFLINDTHLRVKAGGALWVPPGTPHGFTVSSETARVLNFYNPGGFDDRLPFTAAPATARTLPPEGFEDSHDPAAERAYPTASATCTKKPHSASRSPNQAIPIPLSSTCALIGRADPRSAPPLPPSA